MATAGWWVFWRHAITPSQRRSSSWRYSRSGTAKASGARWLVHSRARRSPRGLRLAHVKTLGPSDPDEGYARTRRFYSALGYLQLEETFDLWPDTAALIMVKPLSPPTGEAAVISRTTTPITTATIVSALRAVGVTPGSVIIVHSSMSRLGWIAGDAHSVVDALIASVGHEGTIVMPAHTGLSDPAGWVNPPVPPDWVETIRTSVPAFDPALTPMRGMGRVVECFSRLPEVRHSRHPALGFLAYGPRAAEITGQHWLDRGLDDSSPLGRLYELDARVVLIGVDHGNDTSLHLAEYRADFDGKKWTAHGVPLLVDGVRSWVTYDDLDGDSDDFAEIGQAFVDAGGEELRFSIGAGEIRSCRMRSIVDFAMDWLVTHRSGAEGER